MLHDLQPLVGHMGGRPIRRVMQLSGFSYQQASGLYRFLGQTLASRKFNMHYRDN